MSGPSPLVPSLMVGVLSLVAFAPTLLSLLQAGDEEEAGFVASLGILILPVILLVIIQLISICFPVRNNRAGGYQQMGSSGYDDGFGLGTLLLVVLFFILYNVM